MPIIIYNRIISHKLIYLNVDVKTMNIKNICRCCLATGGKLFSIYDGGNNTVDSLAYLIDQITSVKTKLDYELPEKACILCINKIHRLHNFKLKCEKSNKMFQQLFCYKPIHLNVDVQPMNTEKICRCCLTNGGKLFPIYDGGNNTCLAYMIDQITTKKTKLDGKLADKACILCMYDLRGFYEFKLKCEKSNTMLQQLFCCKNQVHLGSSLKTNNTIVVCQDKTNNPAYLTGDNDECDKLLPNEFFTDNSMFNTTYYYTDTTFLIQDVPEPEIKAEQDCSDNETCNTISKYLPTLAANCELIYNNSDCSISESVPVFETNFKQELNISEEEFISERSEDNISTNFINLTKSEYVVKPKNHNDIRTNYNCTLIVKSKSKKDTNNTSSYHSGKRPFKCKYCGKDFITADERKIHQRHHYGEKPFKCSYCDKGFKTAGIRKIHERLHTGEKPFKCSYCDKAFKTSYEQKIHERLHTEERPYKCSYCEKDFTRADVRKNHERRVHNGEKQFKSNYYLKGFKTLREPKIHKRDHTDERPFLSSYCDKNHTREDLRKIQEKDHYGKRTFNCGYCVEDFKTVRAQKIHERLHTGENLFKCSYCDNAYKTSYEQKMHEMSHTHERPFKCSYCDKTFRTPYEQKVHEIRHADERPFKCSYCEKAFKTAYDQKIHERRHAVKRPFKCMYCKKDFILTYDLKMHERIHTGENPFECSYCDKSFKRAGVRKNHERLHTGEKPFKCSSCDKAFRTSYEKKVHERRHTE